MGTAVYHFCTLQYYKLSCTTRSPVITFCPVRRPSPSLFLQNLGSGTRSEPWTPWRPTGKWRSASPSPHSARTSAAYRTSRLVHPATVVSGKSTRAPFDSATSHAIVARLAASVAYTQHLPSLFVVVYGQTLGVGSTASSGTSSRSFSTAHTPITNCVNIVMCRKRSGVFMYGDGGGSGGVITYNGW